MCTYHQKYSTNILPFSREICCLYAQTYSNFNERALDEAKSCAVIVFVVFLRLHMVVCFLLLVLRWNLTQALQTNTSPTYSPHLEAISGTLRMLISCRKGFLYVYFSRCFVLCLFNQLSREKRIANLKIDNLEMCIAHKERSNFTQKFIFLKK